MDYSYSAHFDLSGGLFLSRVQERSDERADRPMPKAVAPQFHHGENWDGALFDENGPLRRLNHSREEGSTSSKA